ncbi:L-amino acid N-acyltransferase YncA [Luteibacter rhizovicinus]|uniref:L-amino acid N-acyltransferase YncA n=1 Tax=Luteibacter rhizovicinus TaxID=242606 RepID=A0A4R3YX38_9GAMM|nr:GNAT family N-acetyltransferase [Luteibacter rhizovicinus]TCV96398.1 L-amino acid N-acyltransferase YncA [Luteibacter rhizovicinus]
MTETRMDVGRASEADLEGILELQEANQMTRGGTLSASLPRDRIQSMMDAMPLIVARRGGRVTGFLMTTTRTMNADLPIIKAMFAVYHGSADAYIYGPICVDTSERGKGLAQAMFAELRHLEPGREGILFIRVDNEASLRAHARMGMHKVADFQFNGFDFAVFSYIG